VTQSVGEAIISIPSRGRAALRARDISPPNRYSLALSVSAQRTARHY
jgi:hypothetical protein